MHWRLLVEFSCDLHEILCYEVCFSSLLVVLTSGYHNIVYRLLFFCIYLCIWGLDLRLNNINLHHLSSIIIPHYHWHLYWYLSLLSLLLNFWITLKPLRMYLRFRYHKQVSSSFCDIVQILNWILEPSKKPIHAFFQ